MRNYTVTAHTGNEGTKDNSLASIRSAAKSGADIVEFDVLYRRDGTPVMKHSKPIYSRTPTVRAGLEEVAKTNLLVNLDIKDTAHIDTVIAIADELGIKDRCFFTGIEEDCVDEVKRQCPGVKYYLNHSIDGKKINDESYINSLVEKVASLGAAGINCHYSGMNKLFCDSLHRAGLEASVWTCNDIEVYRKMAELGVDNITTRHPTFENIK